VCLALLLIFAGHAYPPTPEPDQRPVLARLDNQKIGGYSYCINQPLVRVLTGERS
jgi:hypothetical protein